MNARQWITGLVLLSMVAASVAGLVLTRDPGPSTVVEGEPTDKVPRKQEKRRRRERRVDMQPLLTARKMAALAVSSEERDFARQAERLADHAVDLAFAEAVRQAAENPPEPTPEIVETAARKEKAQKAVDAERRRVEQISRKLATATGPEKEGLEDSLEVLKAQLELEQDGLNEASESLERLGGDPQARIQRLRTVYEAAQKEPRPAPTQTADIADSQSGSLLARIRAWNWQRAKLSQLASAMAETSDRAQRLTKRRETLAERVKKESEAREAAKRSAESLVQGTTESGASKEAANATAASLRRFADRQRRIMETGKRIQDFQELEDVYANWMGAVEDHSRTALNRVIRGVLWLLLILLAVYVVGRVIDRLFRKIERNRLRAGTLHTVVRLAVQLVGVLVILFFFFGLPDQATTILGLAGAGLTVAMKDFIVAFFGWFILMRRNGIRVGDWVEIQGVAGEVVEIGLLHTVLLETGNWSDAGHPTGRRVSFVNSFAIEGHYFNFSTSGQWMWDELRLLIPTGQDPYPIIDGVQKLVEQETKANIDLAEQEWRKSTSHYRVQTFSAVPGINVVPSGSGMEIQVRYITRAHERHETRRRIYNAVFGLMHGKRPDEPPAAGSL